MTFDNLLIERDGGVACLTINRPKVLNALDGRTLSDLGAALTAFKADASVRVVIITGAGDQAFAAGADIRELAVLSPASARDLALAGQATLDLIEHLGKPVIAAINGYALGGGCELAMACTLRIAANTASLGQPEVNLGLLPGYGGTQRLPRLVGKGRALEMLLTGLQVGAVEAERIGLVNRVVPAATLMDEVRRLAHAMAEQAPIAMRSIIDAVNNAMDVSAAQSGAHEATLFGLVTSTADMREGTRAFLEKRKPAFEGR